MGRGKAAGGHLEVLKYAHENGCPWYKDIYGGHLEVLKYAHERVSVEQLTWCPWNERTGGAEVARERGPWYKDTCSMEKLCAGVLVRARERVSVGQGDVLEGGRRPPGGAEVRSHENGCPWYKDTCSEAAEGGHLEVLKYAHENGCPWDEETCSKAARGGHLEAARERVSVGQGHVEATWRCCTRTGVRGTRDEGVSGGAEVRARERVSVGRGHVLRGGGKEATWRC